MGDVAPHSSFMALLFHHIHKGKDMVWNVKCFRSVVKHLLRCVSLLIFQDDTSSSTRWRLWIILLSLCRGALYVFSASAHFLLTHCQLWNTGHTHLDCNLQSHLMDTEHTSAWRPFRQAISWWVWVWLGQCLTLKSLGIVSNTLTFSVLRLTELCERSAKGWMSHSLTLRAKAWTPSSVWNMWQHKPDITLTDCCCLATG